LTGPAEGKLLLENTKVLLVSGREELLEGCEVYIHVKGYSLARVTHLDVEHPALNKLLPPRGGGFRRVEGVDGGLQVVFRAGRVVILNPLLNRVLMPGEWQVTWVGGKYGGIYIGFRREQVRLLEKLAEEIFGFTVGE